MYPLHNWILLITTNGWMMAFSPLPTYKDKTDPWSSHTIIVNWLKRLPEGSIILDIGTASGTIGRLCNGIGLFRKGIEPNSDWAELARPFYEDFCVSSIEEAKDEFIENVQAVILADVLEHTINPGSLLNRIVKLQRSDCIFLISVPNVANIWIRINLFFGRFEYSERGILDRTHLRFFTRSSFIELLKKCNLEIVEFRPTPIPLYLLHPFFNENSIGRFVSLLFFKTSILFPTLFGYQFVVLAQMRQIRD